MKPDKKLEACTPEALQKALGDKERHKRTIETARLGWVGRQAALESARERLAALGAKEEEVAALRLERQEALAKGQDHAKITARIEQSERDLREMAKEKSLLEDQEAAYRKAVEGCEAYLAALASDLEEHEREIVRIKAGVLANTYNEAARTLAETVREMRHLCFNNGSYAFSEAPRPHGGYWGEGSLSRIPKLRMDWEGVPVEEAYFLRF
ncbi:hypothetical protein JCM15519_35720 [Fundidesulfovibrio butyratiphilus]